MQLYRSRFIRYLKQYPNEMEDLAVKIYIVFWADSFDDWRLEKAFSTRAKAEAYLQSKSNSYWIVEQEVD